MGVEREEGYGFEETLITVIIALAMWVGELEWLLPNVGEVSFKMKA